MIKNIQSYFLLALSLACLATCHLSAQDTNSNRWNNRIYLASYPRSGNHWVRCLIEEASHIATSTVYFVPEPSNLHLQNPFPWGGYCFNHGYDGNCRYPQPGEAVVIKTHYPSLRSTKFDNKRSSLTIRIIRHPIDSIYSYFVFNSRFTYDRPIPQHIPVHALQQYIRAWHQFQHYWDQQPNVLSFRYEDLCTNPSFFLKAIIQAIGYEASEADIQRAIAKYPPEGKFLKHLSHYSQKDLYMIDKRLGKLMAKYGYDSVLSN